MTDELEQALVAMPVVPLLAADSAERAVGAAGALAAGGVRVIEVVLRHPRALDCLRAVVHGQPGLLVGAGTVLDRVQACAALDAGARFLVSPGLDEGVVDVALSRGVPVFPGVATATEAQRAWNLGLRRVKFFPAALAGGPAMIRALGEIFAGMRFFATGGISAANLADYLAVPAVIAVGGSWFAPVEALASGNHARIRALAEEAAALASSSRSPEAR